MKIKVLYHGNCPDGFAAAWAAWMKLGDTAEYIPCSYGHQPPDVTDAQVYILDFSFKRNVLFALAELAESIHILDHHKTAQEDLDGIYLPNVKVTFDMNMSGATLAWRHFHGDAPCWLVDYAEDRDLWRHKLPQTKEINAWLAAADKTWAAYKWAFDCGPMAVAQWGEGCLTWVRYYVDSVKKLAQTYDSFLGYDAIPVVNAPYTATSEVVGELADDALFAVGWHVRSDGKIVYSLRSRGDFDVAKLAESMGGGGHKNAAGFASDRQPRELTAKP